jgi:hypothetical protein
VTEQFSSRTWHKLAGHVVACLLPLPSYSKSEGKFQSELNQPRRLGLENLIESWRADVAVRQMEIRMVEDVEELGSELNLLRFRYANVLDI